ncbi:hypothetical protein DFH08DRAFT_970524 [Mycena albidolilacea]|uniref:Uncharacterized protein n=1 Tax=Mycena albidolilacea TaxID=1033008 RepID=A0AAD7EGR4_9AGAR|nr:hypothetical protein DFH08DRAFT_970524 [Mycena albidolilacea]
MILNLDVLTDVQKPITLRSWAVALIVLTLFSLAISIEACLRISNELGGFPIPSHFYFTTISPRFLTAFFPTLLVAGLLIIWQSTDRSYRELQPYVVLSRGNATAAEGLLTNYVSSLEHVWGDYQRDEISTLFNPAILRDDTIPRTVKGISIQSTKAIGLAPDVAELNAFLAAAGFAEAAVFHNLSDPPFIFGSWSLAEFLFPPDSVLNGTLSVNTTAIKSTANCEAPQTFALTTPGTSNFTIDASNSAGCSGSVTFDPEATSTSTQYGATAIANCGSDDVQYQPVMFWFFHRQDDGTPQGASVFCNPTIETFNVIAEVDLNNGLPIGVTAVDEATTPNNVTGDPLNGQAFNSLKFRPSNDTFVQARAISIGASVSGAIFRFASQSPNGLQLVFDDPTGFLAITTQVFTQHLSLSAKSIYFVNASSNVVASMTCLATRLLIERVFSYLTAGAIPAHILAGALTLIGFSALLLHLVHLRQRRRFFLAASPGSIAHTLSLAAHAQFAHRLYPYDDDDEILRKLAGMRFGLDPRTGAIVADSDGNGEKVVTPMELETGMYGADSSPGTTVVGKDVEEGGAYKFAFGVENESRLPSEQGSTKQLLLPYREDVSWSTYLNGSQRASGQFGVNLETRLPGQERTTQLLPYPGDGANPLERHPPTTEFLPYLGDLSSPGRPHVDLTLFLLSAFCPIPEISSIREDLLLPLAG